MGIAMYRDHVEGKCCAGMVGGLEVAWEIMRYNNWKIFASGTAISMFQAHLQKIKNFVGWMFYQRKHKQRRNCCGQLSSLA
jgi:hypothetical protein